MSGASASLFLQHVTTPYPLRLDHEALVRSFPHSEPASRGEKPTARSTFRSSNGLWHVNRGAFNLVQPKSLDMAALVGECKMPQIRPRNPRTTQWVEDETRTYRQNCRQRTWRHRQRRLDLRNDTYARARGDQVTRERTVGTSLPFACSDDSLTLAITFDPVAQRGKALGQSWPCGSCITRPNCWGQTSPMTRKPGYQFGWDWGHDSLARHLRKGV